MTSPPLRAAGVCALLALALLGAIGLAPAAVRAGEPAVEESADEPDALGDVSDRHETIKVGALRVAIWRPAEPAEAPLPLIVFSAGFTACSTGAPFLTSKLADAGYIVAAPEHADSACAGGAFVVPEAPFGKPQAWSDKTYRQRGRDISAVIDALKSDPRWALRIDAARIGLMGHSLGGHVVLALAGAFPSWQRADVKAVIACAPLIGPLIAKGQLESIHVPVMYQAGGRDAGTAALIKKTGGAYDRTPAATFVELKDATHFAWSGGGTPALEQDIVALAVAFFDASLKGKPFARPQGANVSVVKAK
jgi:predicted dienelactone hydrolase